jgi:hypothetical protein
LLIQNMHLTRKDAGTLAHSDRFGAEKDLTLEA